MTDKPRLQLDSEASRELEALLDDIHGKDRPTVGNGTFKDPWTHTTEGEVAQVQPEFKEGYSLHYTTDGEVWLNPSRMKFDGVCLGAGDHPIDDAVTLLEQALRVLYAYKTGGR